MTRTPFARLGLSLAAVALSLGFVPTAVPVAPAVAQAQTLSVDPQAASLTAADLRPGFTLDPSKTELREPVPGISVYEADFTRQQTPQNFKDGPIEIKSLVARTPNAQQAAEQFTSSRQALVAANPPWTEMKVAKLGDEAIGLTMLGTSSEGDAVAHLYLFRRGAMVVGITVAGLVKPTKMAEAEALAATVLGRIDPSYKSQRGEARARPLNPAPSASGSTSTGGTSGSSARSGSGTSATSGTAAASGSTASNPQTRISPRSLARRPSRPSGNHRCSPIRSASKAPLFSCRRRVSSASAQAYRDAHATNTARRLASARTSSSTATAPCWT